MGDEGTFLGCVVHPRRDARTGGTILPEKGEPFWACLECIEKALKAGLTVRRFGPGLVTGEDADSPASHPGESPLLKPHFPYSY
jgi:hypothetical protein